MRRYWITPLGKQLLDKSSVKPKCGDFLSRLAIEDQYGMSAMDMHGLGLGYDDLENLLRNNFISPTRQGAQ
jgi:hypothetical protein